jgi:hypothetical protein
MIRLPISPVRQAKLGTGFRSRNHSLFWGAGAIGPEFLPEQEMARDRC